MEIKTVKKMVMIIGLIIFGWAGCGSSTEEKRMGYLTGGYVNNNLITSADWLNNHLSDASLLILDARKDTDYAAGHIPGAISVTWQQFSNVEGTPGEAGWGVVLPAEELSNTLSAVGIDKTKTIVVYAGPPAEGWGTDGRFVWMLKLAGIDKVRMLNGGFNHWQNVKGYPVDNQTVLRQPSQISVAELNDTWTTDTDWINRNLDRADVKILDSRTLAEYNGATDHGEVRGGHLPGAIHLDFFKTCNVDGTLKSQAELITLFQGLELSISDHIVVYCTAGIRSAHLTLVLRLAGYSLARNYDASFFEWAGNNTLLLE